MALKLCLPGAKESGSQEVKPFLRAEELLVDFPLQEGYGVCGDSSGKICVH